MASLQNGHRANGDGRHHRLPTLDEALPYIPFTSIVPFNPDIIPAPHASTSASKPVKLPAKDHHTAVALLSALDREANGAELASERLQHTVSDLQQLLQPKDVTVYKFPTLHGLSASFDHPEPTPRADPSGRDNRASRLRPFAELVLAKSQVPFRFSTTKPSATNKHADSGSLRRSDQVNGMNGERKSNAVKHGHSIPARSPGSIARDPQRARELQIIIPRSQTSDLREPSPSQRKDLGSMKLEDLSSEAAISGHAHPTLQQTEPEQQMPNGSQELKVIIPQALTTAQRAEYVTFPEPSMGAIDPQLNLDQRRKSEAAVARLQGLLNDIFEEEIEWNNFTDEGQPNEAQIFAHYNIAESSVTLLQPATLTQLDQLLTKVINLGSLSAIAVDDIARAKALCEKIVDAAGKTSTGIGQGWDESDIKDWSERLAIASHSLTASKTILRIMTSITDEKKLFSEDALRTLLETFRQIVESTVITVVESRQSGDSSETFQVAHANSSILAPIFAGCTRVLILLGNLALKTDLDETAVTSVEYLCRALIFVENASAERESALGTKSFESVRRAAMDVLAKVFARHPQQRQSIIDDILTSLEKLPVTRQSARQYHLLDAKPIQLVSALLMRLVQTSATKSRSSSVDLHGEDGDLNSSDEDAESAESDRNDTDSDGPTKQNGVKHEKRPSGKNSNLEALTTPLHDASMRDARYIVNFLLARALASSKSSDEPYRNLLDIFIEDFLGVLGNPDWPGAELLLRVFLIRLYETSENKQNSAPARAMALELLGSMLSGITDLQLHVQKTAQTTVSGTSSTFDHLRSLLDDDTVADLDDGDLLGAKGPYRILTQYLHMRTGNDPQVPTAYGYSLMQWSFHIMNTKAEDHDHNSGDQTTLHKQLLNLMKNTHVFEISPDLPDIVDLEGRFAAAMVTLRLPFCMAFNRVFTRLMNAMTSDQPSLRSKGLRSVDQVIEKDPAILDRGSLVLHNIIRCLSDPSPSVRDSALGLLARCLALRPALDMQAFESVITRTEDDAIGVKKRSIKMLKDIYMRKTDSSLRSRIADALIHRISDIEESVRDLARQTLEDIWIAPLHASTRSSGDAVQAKIQVRLQASMFAQSVSRSIAIAPVLQDLLREVMSSKSKTAAENTAVCEQLVAVLADAVIEENALAGKPSRAAITQTLAIFASANPHLFKLSHMQVLLPYLKDLASVDDIPVYRGAVVTVRHALPHIQHVSSALLNDTQASLIASIQKLKKTELKEATACLWTVTSLLDNPDRLVTLTRACLDGIDKRRSQDLKSQPTVARQIARLVAMVGHFVSTFELDPYFDKFKERFTTYKGSDVAGLAIEMICPFSSPKQPAEVRENALESLCSIGESQPKYLLREDVGKAIELAFASREPALEQIMMQSFREFFGAAEKSIAKTEQIASKGVEAGAQRIGNTYIATDRDGASTNLAQQFLADVSRIALTTTGALAFEAAQVVASISRSGIVHPKELAPCLVALSTSPIFAIAKLASQEHRSLFGKHESILTEKENMLAIQQAYQYQRDIVHDTAGFSGTPPVAKLQSFWETMKSASAKARKRFLLNICNRLDFDPGKMDVTADPPHLVDFTRFCVENLAFFDYSKADDLQQLVDGLEKVVARTGTGIAHGIEAVLLSTTIDTPGLASDMVNGSGDSFTADPPAKSLATVDEATMRQLAVASQIMMLLWDTRTYLRRLWNLAKQSQRDKVNPKAKTKDTTRTIMRIPNSTHMTERYLSRNNDILASLSSQEAQRALCLDFQKLMSIDDEVRVSAAGIDIDDASEDLDALPDAAGYQTPSEDSTRSDSKTPGTPGKRGRKRKSTPGLAAGGTPKKKKRTSSSSKGLGKGRGSKGKRNSGGDDEDWD